MKESEAEDTAFFPFITLTDGGIKDLCSPMAKLQFIISAFSK